MIRREYIKDLAGIPIWPAMKDPGRLQRNTPASRHCRSIPRSFSARSLSDHFFARRLARESRAERAARELAPHLGDAAPRTSPTPPDAPATGHPTGPSPQDVRTFLALTKR
jgi:hypothetical protein